MLILSISCDRSPPYEFSIDKVPLEDIHIEDVQVKRVCLDAVEFAIAANLGLSLVEVRLCSCLAVELLYVICARVKQITVICLLITCREPAKYQNVLV